MERGPVEPDLVNPWNRNLWVYGLRIPFSLVFLSWITLAQFLAPRFDVVVFLATILATFFGLVVGAHYIDISVSDEKFSPFFRVPKRRMLAIGVAAVAAGGAIGIYVAARWNLLFLAFVAVETGAAVLYPLERPRAAHSYAAFGLFWGAVPFAGSYFIQAGSLSLLVLGISAFVGISVVMMHHLAIMSREAASWKDALFLLKLYRYAVYAVAGLAILGRLLSS